jgi:allantoicase
VTGDHPASPGTPDFTALPDLASRALGGTVLYTNDEFYADVHSLIDPRPPVHDPAAFAARGKVYDGWETRRRREPGEDFVIIRLAVPAIVRGVNIDTSHFRGNYPPFASIDGTTLLGYPTAAEVRAAAWTPLADQTGLGGDRANLVPVTAPDRLVTHVRLTIHPDGGVARLRVFGEVVPDPRRLGGRVDLAATCTGGRVEACSNMFFSSPANALAPGRAQVMSDGWETARRRDDGNDWLVVRLAAPGVLQHAVIDTSRFVGNAPGHFRLSDAGTGAELLPRTRLIPDIEHRFRLRPTPAGTTPAGTTPAGPTPAGPTPAGPRDPVPAAAGTTPAGPTAAGPAAAGPRDPVTAVVRLDIYPDGGISRLRLEGVVPPDRREQIARRWLDLLPGDVAATVDSGEFFD